MTKVNIFDHRVDENLSGPPQPNSVLTVYLLSGGGAHNVNIDVLRNVAGAPGGETTTTGAQAAGTTQLVVAATANLTPGMNLWLWDIVTYNWQAIIVKTVDDGTHFTMQAPLGLAFALTAASIVSASPPLYDAYWWKFYSTGVQAAYVYYLGRNTTAVGATTLTTLTTLTTSDLEHRWMVDFDAGSTSQKDGEWIPRNVKACRYIGVCGAVNIHVSDDRHLVQIYRNRADLANDRRVLTS